MSNTLFISKGVVPPVTVTRRYQTTLGVVLFWEFPSSPVDWFLITVSSFSREDGHVTGVRRIRLRGVVRAFHFTGLKRGERYEIEVIAVTGQVKSSPTVVIVDKM